MSDLLAQLDPNARMTIWIIVVGAITNVACALLGCFLVLRRMSMMGDALSHAVLPGLVVAFVATGTLNNFPIFIGALAVGILAAILIETIHRYGRVSTDSSIGVVSYSLFALGVLLIHIYAQNVHLDADCLLHGLIAGVDLNTIDGTLIPWPFVKMGAVLAVILVIITLFWKELKLSSFDPALATTLGINATAMHYLLMALVAMTAVGAFEQVGSILVIAMLIAPAAAAHQLSDRLGVMMVIASAIAVGSSFAGFYLSDWLRSDIASSMVVCAGAVYAAAVAFAPEHGVLSKIARSWRTSLAIVREDLLAMLFRVEEYAATRKIAPGEARQAVGGGLTAFVALGQLSRRGFVQKPAGQLELTDLGRRRATNLVRSHRLWEAYLVEHLGLPADHVHQPAERMEHFIDENLRRRLASDLGEAGIDPHGRQIPED